VASRTLDRSGGRNESVYMAAYWVSYRKCGKSFTEGENKRERGGGERERAVKGRIIVALRPVSLGSFAVKKKRTC